MAQEAPGRLRRDCRKSLSELQTEALEEATKIQGLVRQTVKGAIRVGKLLEDIKRLSPQGEFMPWVKEHFPYSHMTATKWMRLYRERDKIKPGLNLSITDAYRLIIPPKKVDDSESVESDAEDHPEPEPKKPKPQKVIDEGNPPLQIKLTPEDRRKFKRHKLNNNIIKALLDLLDAGKLSWNEEDGTLAVNS